MYRIGVIFINPDPTLVLVRLKFLKTTETFSTLFRI